MFLRYFHILSIAAREFFYILIVKTLRNVLGKLIQLVR